MEIDLRKLGTEHFSVYELCKSDTATANHIDNTPTEFEVNNMLALMHNVLEPARQMLGVPIIVTSGFRCEELNKLVGGSKTSQHLYGQAADLICSKFTDKKRLFNLLVQFDIDQLLWETNKNGTTWIHVSYKTDGKNRNYINNNYKA